MNSPEKHARMLEDGKYFNEQLGTDKGFIKTYDIVTTESAEDGDTAENGFDGYESCEPDEFDSEDSVTAVDKAIKLLKDAGAIHPSNSPFNIDTWYSTEYETEDYSTDEQKQVSFHPKNFTLKEEMAIYKGVIGK